MKPFRSVLALALLAALPAVGFAQTSAKTSPSPATTKSSPATTKSTSTTTTSTTASSPAAATTTSSTASARTDVYHVHFSHAAPGKATALADGLKQPAPDAPMP